MILPALRPAFHLKDSHPLFAQQSHDRIDQRKYQGIRRGFRKREVKIEVRFNERIGVLARIIHNRDLLSHRRQIFFVNPSCRQRHDLRLQNFAHFHCSSTSPAGQFSGY